MSARERYLVQRADGRVLGEGDSRAYAWQVPGDPGAVLTWESRSEATSVAGLLSASVVPLEMPPPLPKMPMPAVDESAVLQGIRERASGKPICDDCDRIGETRRHAPIACPHGWGGSKLAIREDVQVLLGILDAAVEAESKACAALVEAAVRKMLDEPRGYCDRDALLLDYQNLVSELPDRIRARGSR